MKYYREKKRDDEGRVWTQTRLASVLEISLKTVGEIEIRDSSLDFDRRQRLCELLDVPPILLGIRTCEEVFKEVEERRAKKGASVVSTAVEPPQCWWIELGYPAFAPGKDGFLTTCSEREKSGNKKAALQSDRGRISVVVTSNFYL